MDLFKSNEYLARAVDADALRIDVISNNMAHVNDPNDRGQTVSFEDRMQEALDAQDNAENDFDREAARTEAATLQAEVESAPQSRVDMNTEMANLAKAQLLYQALTSQVSGNFKSLRYVIDNSGH